MEFRHEWKHEISYSDLLALRARLGAVLERDQHAVNGSYQIRSFGSGTTTEICPKIFWKKRASTAVCAAKSRPG